MRLALTQRKKAFSFLSTVGVIAGLDHPQAVMETEDGPSLCAEHPGDGGYAVGCALASRCQTWHEPVTVHVGSPCGPCSIQAAVQVRATCNTPNHNSSVHILSGHLAPGPLSHFLLFESSCCLSAKAGQCHVILQR